MSEDVIRQDNNKEEKKDGCAPSACATCGSKTCHKKKIEKIPAHKNSHISHVIAVVSGKGGVGKSSVSAMLAVSLRKKGYKVGILDADVTGPSIPQIFGIHTTCEDSKGEGIPPVYSREGIPVMSINVLLEQSTAPVVWRGPVITGVIKQFWKDVNWGELDYLLIDMPPGTGDVPLTVYQSFPVDGTVMVTSPQTLVGMIVTKAIKLAEKMNVPILGMIENFSYIVCEDCGHQMPLFGKSKAEEFAREQGIEILAKLPMDAALTEAEDEGTIEDYKSEKMDAVAEKIVAAMSK